MAIATHGKLESRITIPTGNWTFTFSESGGGGTPTVTLTAAAEYYHSSTTTIASAIKAAMDAASPNARTYTVTVSSGNGGTGKYTISVSSGTYSITWIATDLRNLLGFTANLSAVSTATGSNHAIGLWVPGVPHEQEFSSADQGHDEYDVASTESPDGTTVVTAYNRRTVTQLQWTAVTDTKTRSITEATTNESWQNFYRNALAGEQPGFTPGGPVRWHPDADTNGTFTTYKVPFDRRDAPQRVQQQWSGLYTVAIPRLVKV
jgi:hypothetical protein